MRGSALALLVGRVAWLWGLALALSVGCQGGVLVRVKVTGRPPDASTLVVTASHNEVPALGSGQSLSRTPDRFNVQLQATLRGQLKLHLSAQDAQGCESAAGEGAVEIDGPGTYDLEVALTAQQGCTLQVELLGPAEGTVRSTFPGIDCGLQCRQVYGRGQEVSLIAMTSARFGGWFADASAANCVGRVGCTVSIGSGLTRVRANFIRAESCTQSGWCTEEGLPEELSNRSLYAIWGSGRDEVWAVGDAGAILHGDGILWSAVPSSTTRALRGVWGSGRDDVWVVGESGSILHWNGRVWTPSQQQTRTWLNGVWGSGGSDVWAVGDSGTIIRWDGTTWSLVNSGVTRSLRGVWGSGPNDVWAVGDAATILRWNGLSWTPVSAASTSAGLSDVWGTGADNIWLVGESGTILLWSGAALSRQDSGTTAGLHGIWGTGFSQVWAVGDSGVMLHWNGASWSPVALQQPQTLFAGIWGSGPRDVWAVGQALRLVRYRP